MAPPTLPLPATAVASSSGALLVASGTSLHFAAGDNVSSSTTPNTTVPAGLVRKVALSADGKLAVSAGDDKHLTVWNIEDGKLSVRSTRQTAKKVASIDFTADNQIVVTDKVADVYLYPLDPRDVDAEKRPKGFLLAADPSLNPDADLLLGHVSVVSQHVLTPDGKHIITADRDEHIRVSRFPKAYVIERYLFGSEGFVSAIHVPASRPNVLLSAGGESTLQVWDWTSGSLLRRVEIWPAVLPHRRVRPPARRVKNKHRKVVGSSALAGIAPSDDPTNEGFYVAVEGSVYPLGQGVCVEQIGSVTVGDNTAVGVFFSEGCAALHSIVVDAENPVVETLALPYPVLGFTTVPSQPSQLLVTLDTSFGVAKTATEIDAARATSSVVLVDVAADGKMSDNTASSSLVASLRAALSDPSLDATPTTLSQLALFPNLSLFPRWPGFEEDEELAGPAVNTPEGKAELETLNSRQLGRLKARGEDVQDLLPKKKKRRGRKGAAVGGDDADAEGEPDEGSAPVDLEAPTHAAGGEDVAANVTA